MYGLIFNIKHCAIHDGPGLRTTVFFKGCPLHCWWCHNPEGIAPEPQEVEQKKRVGDKSFGEVLVIGQKMTLTEIMKEIEKDRVFFDESNGGVTFSGGEPMMQPVFLVELAKLCNVRGIHTALDTSGYCSIKILQKVLPYIDLYLFDIKFLDNRLHEHYTGVPNKLILKNLKFLFSRNKKTIIRYPLIPGINNSKQQLTDLKALLASQVREIHFLPYHKIARNKYKQIGMEYRMNGIEVLNDDYLNELKRDFELSGFTIKIGG